MSRSRLPAAVRAGLAVVLAGWLTGVVVTAVASLAYRPRGHVGSPLDWARVAGWLVAMGFGAPLRVHSGTDHGELQLVPLTVTLVMVVVAWQAGRRTGWPEAVTSAATAGVAVLLLALVTGSRLHSYGRHLQLHYSVAPLAAGVGALVVVGLAHGLAGCSGGPWPRTLAAALHGAVVIAAFASLAAVGVAAWRYRVSTLGLVPGVLGDGAAWFGGFSMGGRLSADLSSPVPLLSADFGVGLLSGGAPAIAYGLLVVPLLAAFAAGRRLRPGPDAQPWAEFARAAAANGVLWLILAEATRLRFSGRLGADVLSGSAGLDVGTTVFVAALWGGLGAVIGLARAG